MRDSLFSQNFQDPHLNKITQFTKTSQKTRQRPRPLLTKCGRVFYLFFTLFEKSSRVLYFQRKKVNYIKIHAKSGRYITKIGTFERVFHDHPLITDF